jgi:hypothetical protein
LEFNSAGTIDANSAVAVSIGTTNASALNIGRAGGTLSLQGNTSSSLVVSNGVNTTTIRSQNPTANVIYEFAAGTGGTYQLCSTLASTCGTTYAAYYANGYIQLAPGTAQTDGSANPSIFISKTASAYLMRLQSSGTDVFSVHSNGTMTSSGTAYLGGTSGSYAMQVDTAGFKVRIGTGTPTLGGGGSSATAGLYVSGAAEFAGVLKVGDNTNNIAVDGTSKEMTFNGSARHAKTLRMLAEYEGAVLDADGTNNTGTMTAAFDATQRTGYYRWTTGQATSQDYDVVVNVPVPEDWAAWNGNPTIQLYESNASGSFTATITRTDGVTDTGWNAITINPAAAGAWTTYNSTAIQSTGYSAGGVLTVRIKMTAPQNQHVRLGTITFPYLSKW